MRCIVSLDFAEEEVSVNETYDPNPIRPADDEPAPTESNKQRHGSLSQDLFAAINVVIAERTVIPLTKKKVTGNVRLYTYAMLPLIGVIVGLAFMAWINIARVVSFGGYIAILLGLLLIYTIQAGLPLSGFGQAADAIFSGRRVELQLKMLVSPLMRPSALFSGLLYAAVHLTVLYYLILQQHIWPAMVAVLVVAVFARAIGSLIALSLEPLEPEADGDRGALKRAQMILLVTTALSAIGLILTGTWSTLPSLALMITTVVLCQRYFRRHFTGITNKLGIFTMAITELVGLLALLLPIGRFLW